MAERAIGLREVLAVAAVAVAAVLGASFLTGALPTNLQKAFFDSPVVALVVVGGTTWILWRIAHRQPPEV